jgi:hypothetical protein
MAYISTTPNIKYKTEKKEAEGKTTKRKSTKEREHKKEKARYENIGERETIMANKA